MSSSRWSGRGRVRNRATPMRMRHSRGGECTRGTSTRWRVGLEPKETKDALDAVVDGPTVWVQIMLQDAPP